MRFDIENQLSSAQAFTGSATVSTNSYDKGTADRSLTIGRRMSLLCYVTTAAGAGSTHTMDAVMDTVANLASPTVIATVTKAAAALTAGSWFEIPLPEGVDTERYIGFQNTSSGGTTTVSLDVYLVPQDEIVQLYKSFPKTNTSAL